MSFINVVVTTRFGLSFCSAAESLLQAAVKSNVEKIIIAVIVFFIAISPL